MNFKKYTHKNLTLFKSYTLFEIIDKMGKNKNKFSFILNIIRFLLQIIITI